MGTSRHSRLADDCVLLCSEISQATAADRDSHTGYVVVGETFRSDDEHFAGAVVGLLEGVVIVHGVSAVQVPADGEREFGAMRRLQELLNFKAKFTLRYVPRSSD